MAKQSISKPKRICQVEGCNKEHSAKGYCQRHYAQIKKHGKIFNRTVYDLNEFTIKENICYIQLYDKHGKKRAVAIIDAEDYKFVKHKKWNYSGRYVSAGAGRNNECLHWAIIGKPAASLHTDHINRNKLDNRKKNLRICTCAQNVTNSGPREKNTTGLKGVSFDKKNKKWMAWLKHNGNFVLHKRFETKIEAAREYDKAVLKYCDKFAFINGI